MILAMYLPISVFYFCGTLNLQNGVRDDDKTDGAGYCFPYEAANKKGIGRILVATREYNTKIERKYIARTYHLWVWNEQPFL